MAYRHETCWTSTRPIVLHQDDCDDAAHAEPGVLMAFAKGVPADRVHRGRSPVSTDRTTKTTGASWLPKIDER